MSGAFCEWNFVLNAWLYMDGNVLQMRFLKSSLQYKVVHTSPTSPWKRKEKKQNHLKDWNSISQTTPGFQWANQDLIQQLSTIYTHTLIMFKYEQ